MKGWAKAARRQRLAEQTARGGRAGLRVHVVPECRLRPVQAPAGGIGREAKHMAGIGAGEALHLAQGQQQPVGRGQGGVGCREVPPQKPPRCPLLETQWGFSSRRFLRALRAAPTGMQHSHEAEKRQAVARAQSRIVRLRRSAVGGVHEPGGGLGVGRERLRQRVQAGQVIEWRGAAGVRHGAAHTRGQGKSGAAAGPPKGRRAAEWGRLSVVSGFALFYELA